MPYSDSTMRPSVTHRPSLALTQRLGRTPNRTTRIFTEAPETRRSQGVGWYVQRAGDAGVEKRQEAWLWGRRLKVLGKSRPRTATQSMTSLLCAISQPPKCADSFRSMTALGVCQLLLGILKLDSYLYYLLPFPLVLSALRSGPDASRKTLIATFFLTIVLLGPPKAVSYVLLYGCVGITLGVAWHWRWPWWLTWPSCTLSYVAGMFSYIYVAGYLLKENLFKLVAYNVQSTLIQVASLCGMEVNPSASIIVLALLTFLALRGVMYTYVLQFCYALLLKSMGYGVGPMPGFIERLIQSSRYGQDNNR